MKIFKGSLATILLYLFFALNGIGLTSCKKEVIHDTTVVTKTDTTILHHTDTLLVPDSIYNITDGLVAYYNFNSGSLHDSSG